MNIYQPHEYDEEKLYNFLKETNDYFIPALSERVNLREWAKKFANMQLSLNYFLMML